MMFRMILAATTLLALAACDDNTRRYPLEATPSTIKVRASVSSVLVRSVSLPTYAASEEIAFQDEFGVIKLSASDLWADDPERATTLVISRHLNQMTSATVAPEPWPIEEQPKATVDVRVEQLVATNRNTLRLSGQYFVGGQEIQPEYSEDPEPKSPRYTIRARSRLFDIEVPLPGAASGALAVAQSNALRVLSERIAKDL